MKLIKKTELRADEIIKTFELTYLHKKWAGHPKILLQKPGTQPSECCGHFL